VKRAFFGVFDFLFKYLIVDMIPAETTFPH